MRAVSRSMSAENAIIEYHNRKYRRVFLQFSASLFAFFHCHIFQSFFGYRCYCTSTQPGAGIRKTLDCQHLKVRKKRRADVDS